MNEKILEFLKEDKFVSGELLAKKLGISRTAIWKQIKTLKDVGYEIESVKNKGYRIISKPDVLLPGEIKSGIKTKIIGKKIIYFKKLTSTNSFCKTLVKKDIDEGTVVVVDIQEQGKGRKNRNWSSPEGGIWFSVILYPQIPPQNAMIVTMAASVSIVEAIKKFTGLNPLIKWPNDVLINGKKVCGILTELDAEVDEINHVIVGIGINVNNPLDKDLQNIATSLKIESNHDVSRVELFKNILNSFDKNYDYVKSLDYKKIRDLWFSNTDIIGKKVKVNHEKDVIFGIVSDIDESGCLIVNTSNGFEKIVAGDVTFIL
jgi:BirA family transcriptional regulator, biotin operon repressor / biotin---[acetyl-CoA-carboxylase] ligase